MKKLFVLLAVLFTLTLPSAVIAAERHHDWSHNAYHNDNWHRNDGRIDSSLPFRWHEHQDRYSAERVYDHGWGDRFPGLRPYRWHGEGFWYHGDRIRDAMLFYNADDELVSIGFMYNGVFIFVRDDHEEFENHDSFFPSWWNAH